MPLDNIVAPRNDSNHLKYYSQKTIQELQVIRPLWACGERVNKLLNADLNPRKRAFKIFFADTSELVLKSELFEVDLSTLFTGDHRNDFRISKILFRWTNGEFIDPPEIFPSTTDAHKLNFADGRHRTKLSYFLGYKQIPVALFRSHIKQVKRIITLYNIS